MNNRQFAELMKRTSATLSAHDGPGHDVWYEAGPAPPHSKSKVVCECGGVLLIGSDIMQLSMRQLLLALMATAQEVHRRR